VKSPAGFFELVRVEDPNHEKNPAGFFEPERYHKAMNM